MRRLQSVLLAGFIGAFLVVGSAGPSAAMQTKFSKPMLVTTISALPPIVLTGSSGMVDIVRSGATIVQINGFPHDVATTIGLRVPITDPAAAPIKELQITQRNATGNFGAAMGQNGNFGGKMPLIGVNKVCLFQVCSNATANISVPISVIGTGGTTAVAGSVSLTVKGAPWTTGMVPFGAATAMGEITTKTPMGAGVKTSGGAPGTLVQLVTPISISTNLGAPNAVVPAYNRFSFVVSSPEPGVAAVLGTAIGTLLLMGWRRRDR